VADLGIAVRTYLLTKTAITDLVSQRFYADILPQSATLPAIAYTRTSGFHDHILSDLAGLAHARIQFECFADTRAVANSIVEAIRASGIITQKGTISSVDIRGVRIEEGLRSELDYPHDGSDEHRYVASIDLMFDFTET